jgi:hypothetical protein
VATAATQVFAALQVGVAVGQAGLTPVELLLAAGSHATQLKLVVPTHTGVAAGQAPFLVSAPLLAGLQVTQTLLRQAGVAPAQAGLTPLALRESRHCTQT